MWPGIEHVFVPMERLPERFRESFDIMVSNMAWRYFVYPDIALKNLLQALSVGGWANIVFSCDRSPLAFEDLNTRMNGSMHLLKILEKSGHIDYSFRDSGIFVSPSGYLEITKKKSIVL